MKNPDHNYRILLCVLFASFLGFAYWACAFHFFPRRPAAAPVDVSARHDALSQENSPANRPQVAEQKQGQVTMLATSSDRFSVIVLPDTQKYSRDNPAIFCEQTQWIVDNQSTLNIKFVSHLGDIVDSHAQSVPEWIAASKCMGILDGANIPYGIIPGNHDVDTLYREDGMTSYDAYFPASRYASQPWYKGNRKGNQNSYQIIEITRTASSAAPARIMFLNLEIEPSDNTIAWANEVIRSHPGIYTILTTHKYLPDDEKGKRDTDRAYSKTGNTGEDIWNKLVKGNCSIRMTWNGHYHMTDGESMLVSKNACGNDVHQIIQDYQARESGGNGRLRIYEFDPEQKTIRVRTYSPHTKSFETDEDSRFSLPFEIDMP